MGMFFLFSFPFTSVLFSAICKASSDNHFAFLHFFFFGMVLVTTSCTMFLYSSFVYFCHLFLIFSASVRSLPFLSCIVPILAQCILDSSNFLEEISSLSYSIVFLYFFALFIEKAFLSLVAIL